MAELAVTPILLSLTCWVFGDLKGLPPKRSDLYEQGICLLLRQWDEQKGVSRNGGSEIYRNLSQKERQQLLSYIAVRKFEQAENFVLFEESEICSYIAEHLQMSTEESRSVLQAIAQQHGLLIERAQGIWSFSHLTFQEYLVAKWFCDRADWENLSHYSIESRWTEVFLLSIEQAPNIDSSHLLRLMKHQLCRWVQEEIGSETYLRIFLNWVNHKSSSLAGLHKSVAIRAFYFELVCGLDFLGETGRLRTLLGLSGAEVSGYKNMPRGVLMLESILSNTLRIFQRVTSSIMLDRDVILDDYFYIYKSDDVTYMYNRKLQEKLQTLQNQLSELKSKIKNHSKQLQLIDDAAIHSELYILQEELKAIMIQYCNIGHHWEFNEKQKELLKKYYGANILLIKSLHINSIVLNELRETIEEIILLPIAEIEKRKKQSSD